MKKTFPFLSLLLLFVCSSCRKAPDCSIEIVEIDAEVQHDLSGEYLPLSDTLNIQIQFPQKPINLRDDEVYDLLEVEPTFSLAIRSYGPKSDRALEIYPDAKEQVSYRIIKGKQLVFEGGISGYGFRSDEIVLEPELEGGVYTLELQLIPQNSGTFLAYWRGFNENDLYRNRTYVEEDACLDLVKINLANKGISNINRTNANDHVDQEQWLSQHGILFFSVL